MRETYRVPIRDVLEAGGLLKSKILAGAGGQDRTITGLSIVEAPDVLDWVRPHSLVMTGGFPLRHLDPDQGFTEEAFARFVSQLDDLKVSGLAIQFGTYVDEVPESVLELADKLEFPIVELPDDVPFDLLFGHMVVEVAGVQSGVLERTDQLHTNLESMLLEGADLKRIADQVAHVLEIGILITSVDGREMADALTEPMRHRLKEADLYDETGRFRIERVRLHMMDIDSGQILSEPVVAAGSDLARLVAFDPKKVIDKDVRFALRRAATVSALLITQQQSLNAVENKYRGDFLRDVLSGRAKNATHSEEYARGLGWRLDMPCIVVSAQLDPQSPNEQPAPTRVLRSWQSRFHLAWTQVVARESKLYPVADFSDEVVAVFSLPDADMRDPVVVARALQDKVERVVKGVAGDRGGGRRMFSVGTSRLVTKFDELPTAYQQAQRATEVGRRFSGGNNISHFDDLGIHRLIGLIPDHKELTAFARDMLGELADNSPASVDLRNTLQVLLDHNLNVAEASRELLMHYNTMRYRISKLEKTIGPFTTDANLRLNVAVALQVLKIQS